MDVDPKELRALLPGHPVAIPSNYIVRSLGLVLRRRECRSSVFEGSDGALEIYNGVTRATRIAKLSPGTLVRVEVVGPFRYPVGHLPKIGDFIP